jgi:DNA-binding CsgD family transcriptional regulator
LNSNISIQLAVNSYLLRSSLGALIIEEFGNITILEKIAGSQQLISILEKSTGLIIIEDEYLKLLPDEYELPKFVDLIAISPAKTKNNFKGMVKEIITFSDSKVEIIKRIESVIHPGLEDNVQDIVLSEREKEVVKLVAKGFINKEIADMLHLSIHTVITHRKNITTKLGIKTISGLSIYALLNGIIQPNEATL